MLGDDTKPRFQKLLSRPGARLLALGMLVVTTLAVAIPSFTLAALDTPQILSYQGRLTDAQKVTVADGSKTMKFAIYDASSGGTCVWSAGNTDANAATIDCPANVPAGTLSITVTDGLFNVLLGDTTGGLQNALPDSLFNTTSPRYLEITINGETLTPRRRLVSSATALQAGNASLLDSFDTSQVGGSSAFVPVTDSSGNLTLTKNFTVDTNTLFVDSSANRVLIGSTTSVAGAKLEVIENANSTTQAYIVNQSAGSAAAAGYGIQNDAGSYGFFGLYGSGYSAIPAYANRNVWETSGAGIGLNATTGGDIRFYGNTAERMRIENGGNVGIGTSTPGTLLDVNGVINSATGFRIANAATSGNFLRGNGTNFVSSAIQASDINTLAFVQNGNSFSGLATLGTNDANALAIETNGLERFRVDSSGNILQGSSTVSGVHSGYTQDGDDFFTTGSIAAQDNMYADSFTAGDSSTVYGSASTSSTSAFSLLSTGSLTFNAQTSGGADDMIFTTAGSEKMRLLENGNFGVGTASPGALLDVSKSQNASTSIYATNANAGALANAFVLVGQSGSGSNYGYLVHHGTGYTTDGLLVADRTALIGSDTAGLLIDTSNASAPMIFATGGYAAANERMRITSAGNIGIGTTTPTANLAFTGNSAQTVQMERHTTSNAAGNNLTVRSGGATSGATDKAAGTLILTTGTSTGNATGNIEFYTPTAGTSGTTDRTPVSRLVLEGSSRLRPGSGIVNQVTTSFYTQGTSGDQGDVSRGVLLNSGAVLFIKQQGTSLAAFRCTGTDGSCTSISRATVANDAYSNDSIASLVVEKMSDGIPIIIYRTGATTLTAIRCTTVDCTAFGTPQALPFTFATDKFAGDKSVNAVSEFVAIAASDGANIDYVKCTNPTSATPCSTVTSANIAVPSSTPIGFVMQDVGGVDLPITFSGSGNIYSRACTDDTCATTTNTDHGVFASSHGRNGIAGERDADGVAFWVFTSWPFSDRNYGWTAKCSSATCTGSTSPLTYITSTNDGNDMNMVVGKDPTTGRIVIGALGENSNGSRVFQCTNTGCSTYNSFDGTGSTTGLFGGFYNNISGTWGGLVVRNTGNITISGWRNSPNVFYFEEQSIASPTLVGLDLGSSSYKFVDGYFGGTLTSGSLTLTSNLTVPGNATFGDGSGTDTYTFSVADNTASVFNVKEGVRNYIDVTTTNSSESMSFGNTTTNPKFTFYGTGDVSIGDGITPTARLQVEETTASNAALETFSVRRSRSDATAPGAADFGADITTRLEGFTDSSDVLATRIRGAWEAAQTNDTTDRDSYLSFSTMANNTLAEAMRVTSAGNVGIGTAAPASRLHISSASATSVRARVDNTTAEGYADFLAVNDSGRSLEVAMLGTSYTPAGTMDQPNYGAIIAGSSSSGLSILTDGAAPMLFGTSATERMRILSGGNVGIGDATPASLLTVGSGDKFQVTSSGFIGIGLTPGVALDISLADQTLANIKSSNTNGAWVNIENSDTGGKQWSLISTGSANAEGAGHFLLKNNTDTAVRVDIAGNGNIILPTTGSSLSLASGTAGNTFITKIPRRAAGSCASGNAEGWIFQTDGGTQVGHACIEASGTDQLKWYAESFNPTATDVAENYNAKAGEVIEKGDVVALDITNPEDFTVTRADKTVKTQVLGIISTRPGVTLSGISEDKARADNARPVPVALAGRVPTKVNNENGAIDRGDLLTLSSVPGIAAKYTGSGPIIGRALQGMYAASGVIEVFVHVESLAQNTASALTATQTGTLAIYSDVDFANYSINNIQAIRGAKWSIGADGALVVKTAKTGAIIITKTDEQATVGEGTITAGAQSVFITNPAMRAGSKVFMTWTTSPGVLSSVTSKIDGAFTVSLEAPALRDAQFDYWIVDVADERTSAPAQTTAPTTSDPLPPAQITQLTDPATTTTPTEPATTTTPTEPAQVIVHDPAPVPSPVPTPDPTPTPAPDTTPAPDPTPALVSEPAPVDPAPTP